MKKIVLISVFWLSAQAAFCQMYWYNKYDKAFAGGAITGLGTSARLGYEKGISQGLFLAPAIFGEWGKPYQSTYSSYGIDLNLGYSPLYISSQSIFYLKGGAVLAYDKLTGLEEKIGNIGYGVKGGLEYEYFFSERDQKTSVSIFGNQSYFIKSAFGNSRYEVGIQLKFTLN